LTNERFFRLDLLRLADACRFLDFGLEAYLPENVLRDFAKVLPLSDLKFFAT
jgi:hypothetical protein